MLLQARQEVDARADPDRGRLDPHHGWRDRVLQRSPDRDGVPTRPHHQRIVAPRDSHLQGTIETPVSSFPPFPEFGN